MSRIYVPWALLATLGAIGAIPIALIWWHHGYSVGATAEVGAGDCWSSQTKQEAQQLAKSMMLDRVLKLRNLGPDSSAGLEQIVHVSLTDFHTEGQASGIGSASCGASIDLSLDKKSGGSYQSHGTILPFSVHQAESGQIVTMNQADIYRVLMDAANGN